MSYPRSIIVCILLLILIQSGCDSTLNKDYRFKTLKKDLGWSVFSAVLRGKDSVINNNMSIRGTPYELIIWFSAKDYNKISGCEIVLDNLSLINMDTQKTLFSKENLIAKFEKGSDGRYSATFIFNDVDLEYVDYRFRLAWHSSTNCSSINKLPQVDLVLGRDYEERNISFWDALMGI